VEFLKEEARINLTIEDEKVHATGNYNFYLSYTGPLGGTGANKNIKVDIANDEKLCDDPVEQNVYNEYSDLNEDFSILCYTLNEIAAEKMRSLMQRTMPRDIYDIWYLLEIENENIEDHVLNFREKTEYKNLNPDDFIDVLDNKKEIFKRQWDNNLVNQVSEVPDFDEVWRQLKKHWKKL
jgi:predicted nucleotidyltransferase component of viral defense system